VPPLRINPARCMMVDNSTSEQATLKPPMTPVRTNHIIDLNAVFILDEN